MIRLAIFASGSGSNAEAIVRYFKDSRKILVTRIFCNNPSAGVIERGRNLGIPVTVFDKVTFQKDDGVLKELQQDRTDALVLAGFLWLVPERLIQAFRGRIINIHPALLPDFGGKGFYGARVHEAVIASGAVLSGITIHHVNEQFDEGEIIFQAACHCSREETAVSLAAKIHTLEHRYFPVVLEKIFAT